MKVVINTCFGRFNLSAKALKRYQDLKGEKCYFTRFSKKIVPIEEVQGKYFEAFSDEKLTKYISYTNFDRSDPLLVQVVEELGEEAGGPGAELKIVDVNFNVNDLIHDYDGKESIEGYY